MTLLTLLKATGGGGVTASVVGIARTPSDGTDATGASLALTIPAGTAVDDYAVIIVELWDSTATNPTLTYPSGFSQIVNYVSTTDGFQKLKVAIKPLTAADSGTYSVSGFASHFRQGHVAILRGIDPTTALDVAVNLAQNASGTTLPANSITTVTNGCLLMRVIANENSCTGTPDTGYTEQADSNYTKTNTKIQATAGTDTPSGGSFSASTLKLGALIAFRPASGGGGTTHTVDQTDSAGLSDSTVIDQTKVITDSAGLTDIRAIAVSPVVTDSVGLTDASLVELSKLVTQTDSAGLTDAAGLAQSKVLTDSAGLTDAATFTQSKVLTDSSGLTDTSLVESGKALGQTDSTGLTDSQAFSQAHVQTDSTGLTDSSGATVSKILTDSSGLIDAASVGLLRDLVATDSAGLTDATVVFRSAVLTDLVGLADATAFSQLAAFSDSAGLTDAADVGYGSGITPRPNDGITPRPGSGRTARPFSGITSRP